MKPQVRAAITDWPSLDVFGDFWTWCCPSVAPKPCQRRPRRRSERPLFGRHDGVRSSAASRSTVPQTTASVSEKTVGRHRINVVRPCAACQTWRVDESAVSRRRTRHLTFIDHHRPWRKRVKASAPPGDLVTAAEGDERDRFHAFHAAQWPEFKDYETRTHGRIPVVASTPVGSRRPGPPPPRRQP